MLRPGGLSRRTPPVNLNPGDAPLFAHVLERAIPPTLLLDLHDVSVSPDGVLFKGTHILPESFSSPVIMQRFLGRRRGVLRFLVANRLRRSRKRVERPCLWITDDWSHGYFHWVADALARLYVVRDLAPRLTLLLPQRYEQLEFVTSSLTLFGVRDVRYVPAGEVCVCERLVMPTHVAPSGNYDEEVVRGVRELLVDACCAGASGGGAEERVYVSRGRATRRRVENEQEVLAVMRELGFRVVHFEDHAFAEQVRIALGARHLVSSHGAGLTNMLFMRPGGGVLELRREGERQRNGYFNLASAARLRYHYQSCEPVDPGETARTADLRVDPGLLRENVGLLLGASGAAR